MLVGTEQGCKYSAGEFYSTRRATALRHAFLSRPVALRKVAHFYLPIDGMNATFHLLLLLLLLLLPLLHSAFPLSTVALLPAPEVEWLFFHLSNN